MKIQILGMGCKNCHRLFDMTIKLVEELGIEAEVSKVKEPMQILGMGVMRTPALVIEGSIAHQGSMPSENQLRSMLQKAGQ